MVTGYVFDPVYLEHNLPSHPENAARLQHTVSTLEARGVLGRSKPLASAPATLEELGRVHTSQLIEEVRGLARAGGGNIDPDTYVLPCSFDVAAMAAGGTIRAEEAVLGGEVTN